MDFLHPPIYQALIGSLSKCPCPLKSWENRQALQCAQRVKHLDQAGKQPCYPPALFYLAALPSPWEPSIPTPQQNFSEDLILRIVLLKQTLCRILKVTKMSLGRHCDPLQRARDVFAIISQMQAVVCCNSPFPS